MGAPALIPSNSNFAQPLSCKNLQRASDVTGRFGQIFGFLIFFSFLLALAGCGASGYAGGGLSSLSVSTLVIDAGQSYTIHSTDVDNLPVNWTLSGSCGTACGSLSATTGGTVVYTAPPGLKSPIQVTLTATVAGTNNTKTVAITVNPDTVMINGNVTYPVGSQVSIPVTYTGGTAPITLSITTPLPPGLTFNASTGLITGTATTVGTYPIQAQAVDSSAVPYTATAMGMITITAGVPNIPQLTLTGNPPSGTAGTIYLGQLVAGGGVVPYQFSVVSGSLPAGLTLNAATGLISGTPTGSGTSTFTAQVQDAQGTVTTATFSITISAAGIPLSLSSPPNATVGTPYTGTIGVTGGKGPYNCTIVSGTLPAGLTAMGCVISGTPTVAGTSTVTVTATDSSNPQETTTGPVTIAVLSAPATLTITGPGAGTVNVPYTGTIGVGGGTGPYTCSISGALPAGLTSSNCVISGTPTTAGSTTVSVTATDSSNPKNTTTTPVTIVIKAAPVTLTIGSPAAGTVGTPYTGTIGVTGGTGPYTCSISGVLPAGLTASNCTIAGTPTTAGSTTVSVTATDSSNPKNTSTGPATIVINPSTSPTGLTIGSPTPGTVGTPYTGTIGVTGGTGPYTCSINGALPAGLTASNCTITGTPTTAGSTTVSVTATDSSNPKNTTTGPATIVINPAATPVTLTLTSPPAGTVSVPYTGSIGVAGGSGPYTCKITGTLPAGLTASNCTITGTPTVAGTTTLTVTATDSSSPAATVTGPVSLIINPIPKLTLTGTLSNAVVNVAYTQTLTAQGGLAPYTYAVTSGTLPAGLTLSTGGTISGTPTAVGAFSFTVTATDSETTAQTVSLPLILLVTYPPAPYNNVLKGPYAYLFQGYDDQLLGVLAYQTASAASFTADGAGGISAGEIDSNHQNSTATGTIASESFLGTYTLGSDYRGLLTITTINAAGTVDKTTTYAIAVKAPVSPATITTQGSLIESDSNTLAGSKGSGTLLAQTTSSFANGLKGSYAFGLQGDTPCSPSCTVGLVAGPVATVGQFTTNGAGSITSGMADTNDATTNTASAALTGTYTTADTNGRLQLSMTTAGTSAASYPTDYAVYLVDASHAFILSRDTHASYILLAGTATAQTSTAFSNASLNAPFIGYENSYSNPGLLGTTLQNVLNLSTATIFRGVGGTGSSSGTCNITNVDTGGTTALLNGLTGILGSVTGLSNLLAASSQTGTTTCTVAANGRGVLQYPEPTLLGIPLFTAPAPRVLYLYAPNAGYFLETAYAGLGQIEAQTGAPFSEATTFTGTYVYGMAPASSVASIDNSGTIVSNGNGTATETLDKSVGVGALNVVTLGSTSSQTYTTPDPTTGRFTLGTGGTVVLYAITPNRFVLLDTSATATSPAVSLLY